MYYGFEPIETERSIRFQRIREKLENDDQFFEDWFEEWFEKKSEEEKEDYTEEELRDWARRTSDWEDYLDEKAIERAD